MAGEVTKSRLEGLRDGIQTALAKIDQLIKLEAYAEKLPIIGSALSTNAQALDTLTRLQAALKDAVNVVSTAETLATMSTADVASLLNQKLQQVMGDLNAAYGHVGTATATIDNAGAIVIAVDAGRIINLPFTLADLGMSGLGLNLQGSANAQVSYNLDFRLGADSAGFWLDTNATNLSLGAKVDLNTLGAGLKVNAGLGAMNFAITNIQDNDPSSDADTLNFNIGTSWNGSPGILRSFGADIADFRATGTVDLDLHLAADMGSAALPKVSADFHVDWDFNAAILNGSGTNSWSTAGVSFTNVAYDFGSFVSQYVTPILDRLAPYLKPINEALAVFRTDISGLLLPSVADALDITGDGKVTMLDFLQITATHLNKSIDLTGLEKIIDTLARVVDFANYFSGRTYSNDGYPIGNWQGVLTDVQGAVTALSQLSVGPGSFTSSAPGIGNFIDSLSQAAQGAFQVTHQGMISNGATGKQLLIELVGDPLLSFPIIENPASVIQLLLGKDIDLFKLDLPAINIALGLTNDGRLTEPVNVMTIPIWAAPVIAVKLNAAAQVIVDLAAGYDTRGLRQYFDTGFTDSSKVINGFYLDDQRSGGVDKAEVTIRAALELALDFNAGIIGAGGGGNLMGEVFLNLNDALTGADGKLYVDELLAAPNFPNNPFAIFDVSGRLSAGFRAYIYSGPIYWVNWNSPRFTLVTFGGKQGATAGEPDPGLASFLGTSLYLHTGQNAGLRLTSNTTDGAEAYEVNQISDGRIIVSGFGKDWIYTGATDIRGDGGTADDDLILDDSVTIDAQLTGGVGSDYVVGGNGNDMLAGNEGNDVVRGQGGADTLEGGDGDDYLEGGAGADVLRGGAGNDVATYANARAGVSLNLATGVHGGDAAGDSFDSIEAYEGSKFDDAMTGTAGRDVFSGMAGNDTLIGAGGDDLLAGGAGSNTIDGGDGWDIVNYRNAPAGVTVVVSGTSGTATGGTGASAIGDTLTGIEQVEGSTYADTMTGGSGRQTFVGNEGADRLDGGIGDDWLIGGLDGDTLIGGDGVDTASYEYATAGVALNLATGGSGGEAAGDSFNGIENVYGSQHDDTLTGDALANMIEGNDGDDTLGGAAGSDTLSGGGGADTLNGGDDDDVLIGGAGGDVLNGGAGKDVASYITSATAVVLNLQSGGADENDAVGDTFTSIEVYQGTRFADTLTGSDGTEELWGDDGDDTLRGMGGNDVLRGLAGNDAIDGGAGDDVVEGNLGNDTVHGGADNDSVLGGDGDDSVYGDGGDDILSGGQGNDRIDGGTGRDRVTYLDAAATAGIRLNLSARFELVNGVGIAALSAIDGYGTTDSFDAIGMTGTVEDATGSMFGDSIVAHEGGSTIDALDGNDSVLGLGGNDVLRGGVGNDTLDGGEGDDTVMGGAGSNALRGSIGADWASFEDVGGTVTASLHAGSAAKSIGGSDTLLEFENLRGSAGGDTLTGNAGANRIEGMGGNDTLDGWAGADTLVGGAGDDVYFVDNASGDVAQASDDTVVEESGYDLVRSTVNYTLGAGLEDLQLLGAARNGTGNGDGNLLIGNAQDNVLDGLFGSDTFWGYAGNDTYVFDQLGDRIGTSTAFRGTIAAAGEVDGGGVDTIRLATTYIVGRNPNGSEFVWTYALTDTGLDWVENLTLTDSVRRVDVVGNALGNTLIGNDWSAIMRGGDGDDVLNPGLGSGDAIDGGAGLDTLVLRYGSINFWFANYNAPTGTVAAGYAGTIYAGTPNIYTGFDGIERFDLEFGGGDDSIRVGDGDDIVKLGAGSDFTWIGKGYDRADGGMGSDGITADYSDETIAIDWNLHANTYSEGTDGTANDRRGFANFEYFGELKTGSGNDIVTTTTGYRNELIITGAGDDRATFYEGSDNYAAGTGLDTLVVDWSANNFGQRMYDDPTVNAALGGFNGRFNIGTSNWDVVFTSVERFEVKTGNGGDTIVTASGDDIVFLNGGDDTLDVRTGFDRADGGAGRDRISADYRTDTLGIHWDLTANTYSEGADGTANDQRSFTNFEYFGLLYTGSGNDVIVTTATGFDAEIIDTGAGDDRATFKEGSDHYRAGAGLDTLVIDWSANANGQRMYDNPSVNASLGGFNGRFNIGTSNWDVVFTSVERFEVKTGNGDDTIVTATGDDIVFLNGGNDFLDVGSGRDEADGGAGNDRISANYGSDSAAILWDLAANSYSGSGRAFTNFEYFGTLVTGSGNDVIVTDAIGAHELIETGLGDDRVTFRSGSDNFRAGGGSDTLVVDWSANNNGARLYDNPVANAALGGFDGRFNIGTSNWDVVFTSVEHFEVRTGNGGDTIVTATGNDVVETGGGNDDVNVGSGNDRGDGGSGVDRIAADYSAETVAIHWNLVANTYSEGSDGVANDKRAFTNFEYFGLVRTGSGNDVIEGDGVLAGGEDIRAGAGDDRVTFHGGSDAVNGETGTDTLVADWRTIAHDMYLYDNPVANTTLGGFNGRFHQGSLNWNIFFTSIERFEVYSGSGNDTITTATGDDIVVLGAGNDFVDIGSGVDRADGGTGTDRVSGNYATDTGAVIWNMLTNSYSDGAGRSFTNFEGAGTFVTGSGNDMIVTGKLRIDETFRLGAGDDVVTTYNGSDLIDGGAGFDTLIVDWTDTGTWFANYDGTTIDTNGGFRGSYYSGSANIYVTFRSVERFDITTGNQNDNFATGDGDDRAILLGGNDEVWTGGGADYIDGGTGDDRMHGGLGNDIYIVDSLGDWVDEQANAGTDEVRTALVSYSIAANAPVENLTGTSQSIGQTLTGNAANNIISGAGFGDILDGGAGDDTLRGGDGNDFLKIGSGANDQLFGDGGTDTLVLSGALADYGFTTLGDGRVKVVDTRDPTGTIAYLTSIERVEFAGGSVTLAQAIAGDTAAKIPGSSGNDTVVLTVPRQVLNLAQGGTDAVTGTTDIDYILFGAALDPTDVIDARGGIDQLGLQGNYSMTLGTNILGIDFLALLSGANTDFGDSGVNRYSYALVTSDATVASGTQFVIQANALLSAEPLSFDGRAETDGSFFVYAGFGTDTVRGGANADRFFFGEGGRFTAADAVDGSTGTDDQLGLRGDYASAPIVMTATSMINIDTLVLLSATDTRFGSGAAGYNYDITTVDANVAAGAQLRVSANTMQANETVRFDGSAETDGRFFLILGAGADVAKGGGGADTLFASGGADTLTGGGGADIFLYRVKEDSLPTARDTITDLTTGDRIDLSRIDAISGGANDAFSFIGGAAFTAAGQLRVTANGSAWLVEGDIDGDGIADFAIDVGADHPLVATDFIL